MEDIIIMGGGLAGSSLASALANRGCRALVLEAGTIGGGGATAHSRGMVRLYDDEPRLAAFNREGIALWAEVDAARPGLFSRPGMVYALAPHNIEKARNFAQAHGAPEYPVEIIDGRAASGFCPVLNPDITAPDRFSLFEPGAGYIDPRAGARFFADEATRLGATIIEGCLVEGITTGSGFVEVQTSAGRLTARRVVLASGADTLRIVPVDGLFARSISLTSFLDDETAVPTLCIIDEISKGYIRPGAARSYYVGGATQSDAGAPDRLETDDRRADAENLALSRRLLTTTGNAAIASHPGYDAYTRDYLPLIEAPREDTGIGLFTGFSGRGAKYIPAMARRYAAQLTAGTA
ncbi:MAG TPA: FAD-dependent oxidoreductase [Saliniramus sp.]|nr:FAD-dependent oxidoreductase [Saliniramus sp.]